MPDPPCPPGADPLYSTSGCTLLAVIAMPGEYVHCLRVDRDVPARVALGVLLDKLVVAVPDDGAGDGDASGNEVYVAPPQGAQLAAARSRHRGQAKERREVRIAPLHLRDEEQYCVRIRRVLLLAHLGRA